MIDRETHCDAHTEIEVTDFGPIVRGKVTLRPLTVFVGPSNTGKSYLAMLIYALHGHFGGYAHLYERPDVRSFTRSDDEPQGLARADLTMLDEAAKSAAAEVVGDEADIVPPKRIVQAIRREIESNARFLDAKIARCFGAKDASTLIRKRAKNAARVEIRQPLRKLRPAVVHELTLSADQTEYIMTGADGMPIPIAVAASVARDALSRPTVDKEMENAISRLVLHILAERTLSRVAPPFHVRAYYLPADRAGTMHAHRVVVSALVQSATRAGIQPTAGRTAMLSGVLADFLDEMLSIDRHTLRNGGHNVKDRGAEVEKSMLNGKIEIERDEIPGYPNFFYRPARWKGKEKLPLMNASSMVSELAPVVLYLRHMVEPGEVLIVEEPESHLHPAMQAELMRQLVGCVRAGIRIIVTTHSEWLMEELANIVKRSEIPEERRKSLPNGDAALPPDRVGVHLFQPRTRPRGSIVSEVFPDERGLYPTGFDDVAMSTHNQWADIASLIGDDK